MSNILSEVHPELVTEWSDKNLPLTPDRITYGSNKVVWWKGACGHEWQTSVKARSNGENCPICSGARVIEGINDLATLKPELADEWSSKNDPLKPTMVTTGSHKKVIWQDKYGHEWTTTVKSRALNGTGCPYCSHNKILVGFNDLASQRPQIASEWSERNYPLKPDMVTVFANRKVWWRCSKGHEYEKRSKRTIDVYGYEDDIFEQFHPKSIAPFIDPFDKAEEEQIEEEKEKLRQLELSKVRQALSMLQPVQRERLLKSVLLGISSRKIAKEEGINYSSVDKSIAAAIKNFKKFYKNL